MCLLMAFIRSLINEQRRMYKVDCNGFIRYHWINNMSAESCDGCLVSVYLMDQHVYWLKAFLIIINLLLEVEVFNSTFVTTNATAAVL